MNTTPDTEAPKLDPFPFVNPQFRNVATVPRGYRYSYQIKFGNGTSHFAPRPAYSQNRKDYPNA